MGKSPGLHAGRAAGAVVALMLLGTGCALGQASGEREGSVKVTGSLVYRTRIALPDRALAIAELRETGAGEDGTLIGEQRIDLDGGQVPIPFGFAAPKARIDPGKDYAVRGAIFVAGRPRFATEPAPVSLADGNVDLGELELLPFQPEPFPTDLECGDRTVRVSFLDDAMQLNVGGEIFPMRNVAAASGAKYEAQDDPTTVLWSKGAATFVQVRGQAFPACAAAAGEGIAAAAPAKPLTARGNEPGWNLTIGAADIELVTDYGATRSTFPRSEPAVSGEVTRYVIPDGNLTIALVNRPCADTMSGMFYPRTVTVETAEGTLSGCGGEPASLLLGAEWVVESIDGTGTVGGSRVTITFRQKERVGGLASCNAYNAAYELTGEGLTIDAAASTMKACAPSLMEQERRFFAALAAVTRFEIAPDGALVLLAGDGQKLIARR